MLNTTTPSSLVLVSEQVTSEAGNVVCTSGGIAFTSRLFVAAKISFSYCFILSVVFLLTVVVLLAVVFLLTIFVPTNMSR